MWYSDRSVEKLLNLTVGIVAVQFTEITCGLRISFVVFCLHEPVDFSLNRNLLPAEGSGGYH